MKILQLAGKFLLNLISTNRKETLPGDLFSESEKSSALFGLNLNDFAKGFIVAALAGALGVIYDSVNAGSLDWNWDTIRKASLLAGAGYLLKNLGTPSKTILKMMILGLLFTVPSFAQTNSAIKAMESLNSDSVTVRFLASHSTSFAGDSTTVGWMYYNKNTKKWRVYQNGIWSDLVRSGSFVPALRNNNIVFGSGTGIKTIGTDNFFGNSNALVWMTQTPPTINDTLNFLNNDFVFGEAVTLNGNPSSGGTVTDTGVFGGGHIIGDGTTFFSGSSGFAYGDENHLFNIGGMVGGSFAEVQGGASANVNRGGVAVGLSMTGRDNTKLVTAGANAINISANTAAQTVGHGALGSLSAIIGGQDGNIPSTSARNVILGGNGIKARSSENDQVYVNDLNVQNGVGTVLTRLRQTSLEHGGGPFTITSDGDLSANSSTGQLDFFSNTSTPSASNGLTLFSGAGLGAALSNRLQINNSTLANSWRLDANAQTLTYTDATPSLTSISLNTPLSINNSGTGNDITIDPIDQILIPSSNLSVTANDLMLIDGTTNIEMDLTGTNAALKLKGDGLSANVISANNQPLSLSGISNFTLSSTDMNFSASNVTGSGISMTGKTISLGSGEDFSINAGGLAFITYSNSTQLLDITGSQGMTIGTGPAEIDMTTNDLLITSNSVGPFPVTFGPRLSTTQDFASTISLGETTIGSITLAGASTTDVCNVTAPASVGVFTCRVTGTNTISITFHNTTAAPVDPASGTYQISLTK